MKISKKCLHTSLAIAALLSADSLLAQTLTLPYTGTGGSISHEYDLGNGFDSAPLTFGNVSARLVDYNTVAVSVTAPAGQQWQVAYDSSQFDYAQIQLNINYNNSFGSPYATITGSTWDFDFVNGSAANLTGYGNYSTIPNGAGDRLQLDANYGVTGNFSFTGFTATISYDNSSLAAAALSDFYSASLTYQYSSESPLDPGSQFTIAPVPEPGALALFGLGTAGICVLRFTGRLRGNRRDLNA